MASAKEVATKVKKTVKKAEVKKDVKDIKKSAKELVDDLRGLSDAELNKALIDAKADLKKAKQMLRANELPASHVIKQMKTKVARIHTVMTEKSNNKEAK